jgi:hypothetical protein
MPAWGSRIPIPGGNQEDRQCWGTDEHSFRGPPGHSLMLTRRAR